MFEILETIKEIVLAKNEFGVWQEELIEVTYGKKTDQQKLELRRICDRDEQRREYEPTIVKKGVTRISGMDEQILCLYAKGLSTRDIVEAFQEMYGVEVSAGLVSQVTNAVLEQVREWQTRPLDEVYPIVYLDCIVLKIRQDKRVIKKAKYAGFGSKSRRTEGTFGDVDL